MNSKYYKKLDLIRLFSCFAILLYHIGILKGGYLAVCTFFVLSSYLSIISSFKQRNFSLKKYYINRLKKIYIPLLIVVFLSIFIITLIPNNNWMNLKPETTSILLGYNNYWQLNANLDYFVRHISSPFMHLWYISILIQFEIFFPLIFIMLKKLGRKVSKALPCMILLISGIASYIYFSVTSHNNIMLAYYGTFTRLFSLLFGLLLGFIHVYYHPIKIRFKKLHNILFWIYLILLMILFCIVNEKSILFNSSMIITTFISMRLIDYGISDISKQREIDNKISDLSKISYEVYLVQYPIIFLFQKINLINIIEIPLIIIITFIVSYIINNSLKIKKHDKYLIGKIIVVLLSIFGLIKYITAKDYSKDMKKLEEQLKKNRSLVEEKQKEFEKKAKTEQDEWNSTLNDLNSNEEEIKEKVRKLKIVGVGDSIMLGTINQLYNQFPNGYFDGKVNRTPRQTNDVLLDIKNKGLLGDVVLFNIGTNGEFYRKYTDKIMETVGDRKVFWVNATHADYDTFNGELEDLAKAYDNIHIIDWVSVTKGHPEYLSKDQVHPTTTGAKVYAETIFNAIYEEYLNEYKNQKDKKIKEHEEEEKTKITFIGNDLLLGIYDDLQISYSNDEFIIDDTLKYKSLKELINKKIKDKSLSYNVVLVFNSKSKLMKKEYQEIINLCKNYNIYIVDMNDTLNINKENVTIINYYKEIKKNDDYIDFDGIHLTDKGNKSLYKIINKNLSK